MATIRATFSRMHEYDHLAAEFEPKSASRDQGQFPERRGSRGPIPQFTEGIAASVAPNTAKAIRIAAGRRSVSKSALVRQILEAWVKANQEAWQ